MPQKPSVVVHSCYPSTQKLELGESEVHNYSQIQGQPGLHKILNKTKCNGSEVKIVFCFCRESNLGPRMHVILG